MSEVKKLIPKRRFAGFTDDWEQRKLGELAETYSGGTPEVGNKKYYGGTIPFIRSGEINSNRTQLFITDLGLKNSSARLVDVGDILYAMYGATSGEVGISQIEGAINQAILAIKPTNSDPNLIMQWLKKNKEGIVNTYLQGGQGNLSSAIVKSFSVDLPINKIEQQQLGNFFKTLDDTIALHQRELDKSKALKLAYLSEMFPAEGETKPKRRFTGFTDDWEQLKLGEHTKLITKGTTPKEQSMTENINFIKVENLSVGKIYPVFKISEAEHNGPLKRSILNEGDILFSIAGTLGRVAVVEKSVLPANTNQALAIIRGCDFNQEFIRASLSGRVVNEYIEKNPTIGAQPNLSLEQIGNLAISTPSILEQQKIGNFFKKLDDKINLHQQKLEKLKNIKEAYLNEMFI